MDELDETLKQAVGCFLIPLQAKIFPPGLFSSPATVDVSPGCTKSTMSPLAPKESLFLSITHMQCSRFAPATAPSQDTRRILVVSLQASKTAVSFPFHPVQSTHRTYPTLKLNWPYHSLEKRKFPFFLLRGILQGEETKPQPAFLPLTSSGFLMFSCASSPPQFPTGRKGWCVATQGTTSRTSEQCGKVIAVQMCHLMFYMNMSLDQN